MQSRSNGNACIYGGWVRSAARNRCGGAAAVLSVNAVLIRISTLEIADLPSQSQGSLKIEAKVDRRDYILQELLTVVGQYRKRGDFIYLLLRRLKDRTRDVPDRGGHDHSGRNEP